MRSIDIKWKDKAVVAKVKLSITEPNQPAAPQPDFSVSILSVNGYTPGLINGTATQTVELCSTQAFPVAVPSAGFPASSSTTIEYYIWELPAGWQPASGTPIFGNPTSNQYVTYRSMNVVPTVGSTTTQIRVRAYSQFCNNLYNSGSPYTYVSDWRTLSITRTPTVTLSPRSSQIGTLACGEIKDIEFTATTSQQTGNPSYQWSKPSLWSVVGGSLTGPSVTLRTDAISPGQVSVTVTYNCVSPAYVTPAQTVNVAWSPEVAPPVIFLSNFTEPLCYGETFSIWATARGGSKIIWTIPYGLAVSKQPPAPGQPVETAPGEVMQVWLSNPNWYGDLNITARAANPGFGCLESKKTANLRVVGRKVLIGPDHSPNPLGLMLGTEYGPDYTPVTCGVPTWLTIPQPHLNYYGSQITNFTWEIDGQVPPNSANQFAILHAFQAGGGSVRIKITNRCGEVDAYPWSVPVVGPCSSGPIDPQPCDCGRTALYPNPAADQLTVEQERGSVVLRNGQGRAVYEGRPQQGKLVIDTKALPAGLYYLEHRGDAGRSQRRQVSIVH